MIRHALPLAFLAITSAAFADERPKSNACRSVHLSYSASQGTAFYNEVTVEKSSEGTYFMVCGWSKGYFGIQELGNGKKLLLFSVWDPTNGNNAKKVNEADRVKLLHKDDAVRVGRFGNEGTGGQAFFDYEWKTGETYKFLVTAKADGEKRTAYAGYFYHPESKAWKHLVTFSTIANGKLLEGYYSFIEDFRRNKISATKERVARFGNGWVQGKDGTWVALTKATFTGDATPVENINAAVDGDRFLLATGGDTKNSGAKLRETMSRGPSGVVLPKE